MPPSNSCKTACQDAKCEVRGEMSHPIARLKQGAWLCLKRQQVAKKEAYQDQLEWDGMAYDVQSQRGDGDGVIDPPASASTPTHACVRRPVA